MKSLDASRWLTDDQTERLAPHLAGADELLLVAAGQGVLVGALGSAGRTSYSSMRRRAGSGSTMPGPVGCRW